MISSLRELLAPPTCSGCDVPGVEWCPRCATVAPEPQWTDIGIPVRTEFSFAGPVRRTIIDWKDENQRAARGRVREWLAQGLEPLLERHAGAVLVAVPASPRSVRRRGGDVLYESLARAMPHAPVEAWLRAVRDRADQSGLNRSARSVNLRGSMEWVGPVGRTIIVVDDVLTTGATLRESARAARQAGAAEIIGFAIAHREHRDSVADSDAGLRLP
jgi:predicted amidophosphoribosyltransferase